MCALLPRFAFAPWLGVGVDPAADEEVEGGVLCVQWFGFYAEFAFGRVH